MPRIRAGGDEAGTAADAVSGEGGGDDCSGML
ncbi:hypothetical protein B1M_17470 [Burkholderia sp. TJI49]|nr:hypothetical protein B1M_17470 [Burkholderia sp. TJI49]